MDGLRGYFGWPGRRGGEFSPNLQNTKVSHGFFGKEFRPERSQYSDRSESNYNEASANYQVAEEGGRGGGDHLSTSLFKPIKSNSS